MLEIASVRKEYRGLRPLRIASLLLRPGERIALSGIDAVAAEVLVSLITGAALPDEGEVRMLGRSTRDIATDTAWLESLDRFGIVTARAVLLEEATVAQNLAMPYTLQIDPVPDDVRQKVVANAEAAGVDRDLLRQSVRSVSPEGRVRVHLARAIAPDPDILVLEHPTVGVARGAVAMLARDVRRIVDVRGCALLAITEDEQFAEGVADRRFRLHGGTGELMPVRKRWFR